MRDRLNVVRQIYSSAVARLQVSVTSVGLNIAMGLLTSGDSSDKITAPLVST